jgi:hypothetical protein
MLIRPTAPLIGAICAAFLASALPADASLLSGGAAIDTQASGASSLLQDAAFGPPAGHRCLKWTRRMNTRHGFARRCVQWR